MLKIRRPLGRLIFNMGIAIPGKIVFLIETPPSCRCEHTHVHSIVQNIESYFRLYRNIANDVIMERRVNSVEHLCDYTFPIPQTKIINDMILKESDFGRICTEYCVMDLVIIDDSISEELF